jgi:uncharacterized protein GlcG (DUF336 family)
MALRLIDANQAIEAALAKASELGFHISVSVSDGRGHLIAHQRMDGVLGEASRESMGKAIVAAATGHPSENTLHGAADHPLVAQLFAMGAPVIHRRGGLPIIRGTEVDGGLGVSGAPTTEQDEECAHAGIRLLGGDRQL